MYSSLVVAAVAALICGSNGLAIRNKHVADFRLFGQEGCSQDNQGVWTVIDDDFKPNECKGLNGNTPKSISTMDINPGCTISFYNDAACTTGKRDCPQGRCCNSSQEWKAWSMVCS